MQMRQQIQLARSEFMHRGGRMFEQRPSVIFLSPTFHTDLCEELSQVAEEKIKTIVGARLYGMQVHLVPSLASGFHIA